MKYEKDPVIEEIREVRRKIFKEFHKDPKALGKHLMEMDRQRKVSAKRNRKVDRISALIGK